MVVSTVSVCFPKILGRSSLTYTKFAWKTRVTFIVFFFFLLFHLQDWSPQAEAPKPNWNRYPTRGVRSVNLTAPCGFTKNVCSKEKVKPFFNIIISHIFPKNSIWILSLKFLKSLGTYISFFNIYYIHQFFWISWHFLTTKKT